MKIDLLKCHGTGNDFILIDERKLGYTLSDDQRRKLAIELCDRQNSLGADGILWVQNSHQWDAKMRIFNADGSEALMCGNGLRCFGRYIIDETGKNEVMIETLKQDYKVKKIEKFYEQMNAYEILLGNIKVHDTFDFKGFEENTKPYTYTFVTISNPHAIAIVDKHSIFQDDVVKIGINANERKDVFQEGVNVSFVTIVDNNRVYVRTYERGVGLTKSCGTGMTASTTVVCLQDESKFDQWIDVYNDGGMIRCHVHPTGENQYEAKFAGNATNMFRTCIEVELETMEIILHKEKEVYVEEEQEYQEFFEYTRRVLSKIEME